jgi:hypothetical protein
MTTDLTRRVANWCAEVSVEARPAKHDGPCGSERLPAPCGALGPVALPAERLRNGWVACHLCGQTFRPGELVLCEPDPAG